MLLDYLDHPRNLFLLVPLGKCLLVDTLCPEVMGGELEQLRGLCLLAGLFGHFCSCGLSVLIFSR